MSGSVAKQRHSGTGGLRWDHFNFKIPTAWGLK